MRVAILTICDYFNHGNRLQNLALQDTLTKLGHEVETINIPAKKIYTFSNVFSLMFYKRMLSSYIWGRKYINGKMHHLNMKKLQKYAKKFDYVIVGSDQMFNPLYMANPDISFLKFVDKEKRVAYAPSFGIDKIPERYVEKFKDGLKDIDKLSVREKEGKDIVDCLCQKNAQVVLDPTLLLDGKVWKKYEKPLKIKKKYLLTYNLGVGDHKKKEIKALAKRRNLKVIELNNFFCKYHHVNPSKFLWLIDHAEAVFTNSFHGHALAIALKKPFVSLAGFKSTNSRLKNLLSLLNFEDRFFEKIDNEDMFFKLDYKNAEKILKKHQNDSIDFLKNSLEAK